MKNFISKKKSPLPLPLALVSAVLISFQACDESSSSILAPVDDVPQVSTQRTLTPASVARMLAEVPITLDQVREVWDGVTASSDNGYDEEYTFSDMFSSPGRGVGDDRLGTRGAEEYSEPLHKLVSDYLANSVPTRSSSMAEDLSCSDLQIYWPYSEDWDGSSMPVITFCPEMTLQSNVGFMREELPGGQVIIKEIVVDEPYAMSHPVWVVGWNEDAGAMTPQMLEKMRPEAAATRAASNFKTLKLKEFKAHVHYDPWLSGGSEFFVKCGSLKAFTATVASDLTKYTPEITDLMIKVKRKQIATSLRYNTVLVPEWSSQLSECVFLIHEDDGGKVTSWKASGEVKIKSKSYGFSVELPYHRNDDIVWRGKLSSSYFEKNNGVANRYGDVSITFVFN
ncbi:MAG: hypothetical protein J6L98_06745 [Bacteroidales bacterium]|nr:hypothetical protein [Bacteroidales bacterium]